MKPRHKKSSQAIAPKGMLPMPLPRVYPFFLPRSEPRTKKEKKKALNDALLAGFMAFAVSLPMSMWNDFGKKKRKRKVQRG